MPKRKGEENLIPMNMRSKDEARETGRKGGIASGEARRAKKSLANIAKEIAQQPAPEKLKGKIKRDNRRLTMDNFRALYKI